MNSKLHVGVCFLGLAVLLSCALVGWWDWLPVRGSSATTVSVVESTLETEGRGSRRLHPAESAASSLRRGGDPILAESSEAVSGGDDGESSASIQTQTQTPTPTPTSDLPEVGQTAPDVATDLPEEARQSATAARTESLPKGFIDSQVANDSALAERPSAHRFRFIPRPTQPDAEPGFGFTGADAAGVGSPVSPEQSNGPEGPVEVSSAGELERFLRSQAPQSVDDPGDVESLERTTGGDSQPQNDAPPPVEENRQDSLPTEPVVIPSDRFVSAFNIGHSANNPATRNIGRIPRGSSWETFVRLKIEPEIERGIRRFHLHNPFGALADEAMQLDQYIHAQEMELDFITEGFAEAWRPVTARGIEVIAYVGCGAGDPDFDSIEEIGDSEAWQSRAMQSVQPFLDARMSIGLDAAVTTGSDSQTYAFAKKLRDSGTRVYVEAKPTRFDPHWFSFDVIARDTAWLTADLDNGFPQAKLYGIRNDQLLGESLRMLMPRWEETWDDLKGEAYLSRLHEILADGQSVLGTGSELLKLRPEVVFEATPKPLPASFD